MPRNGFWDRYWEHASQLLANFFPVLRNIPEGQLGPDYLLFLKWQIIRYFWVLA